MKQRLRQFGRFCASMKCGVLLMALLAVACVLGSLVEQGHTLDWYLARYSERGAALIYGLQLDDVFHSVWFLILAVLLCCNLALCSLLALPARYQRWKDAADPEKLPKTPDIAAEHVADPAPIFARLKMPKPVRTEREGKRMLFSSKNRLGIWGSLFCHLGVLLLLIGFTFSQVKTETFTIYGVPGQSGTVGDTGYTFTIDAFDVEKNENGSVVQYTTKLTLRDTLTGAQQSGAAGVNSPANLLGWRVYQNSTGDAARLTVTMDGTVQQQTDVCVGDGVSVLDPALQIYLLDYIADYYPVGDKVLPGYAYAAYYDGQEMKTGVQVEGDAALRYESFSVSFSDPQSYTLLQLKQDNYVWLAFVGGVVTLLGMLMAFYLPPKQVWAIEEKGGWTVCGAARKAKVLFAEQFREAAGLPEAQEDTVEGGQEDA